MKILFVASGNSKNFSITPFIQAQSESLKKLGIIVDYFPISGKGISGYLKNVKELRTFLKRNKYDLIHSHYSLSGWVSVLGGKKQPIVLSLMGDDAYGEYVRPGKILFSSRLLKLTTLAIQPFVDAIISKSKNIDSHVYRRKISYIIPNGVCLDKFKTDQRIFEQVPNLDNKKKYILFLGNLDDKRKNYALARQAVDLLNEPDIELVAPYPVSHDEVVQYLNSTEVFIMTTFMEGSPNVIKEAMACNCPIVSSDVGDVRWVIGNTKGCYISSFCPEDFAQKIKLALDFRKNQGQTTGRERILELGLDSETIAKRILQVYNEVLKTRS